MGSKAIFRSCAAFLGLVLTGCSALVAADSEEGIQLELRIQETTPQVRGTWKTLPDREGNRAGPKRTWFTIRLRMPKGRDPQFSRPADQFPDLFVRRAPDGPLRFEVESDAGVLHFEGERSDEKLNGVFQFRSVASFTQEVSPLFSEPTQPIQWLLLALSNAKASEIVGFASTGLRFSAEGYLTLKSHGVQREYVQPLLQSGQNFDVEAIARMRDHAVPPGLPSAMRKAGYDFKVSDYCLLRDHTVSAAEAGVWRESGYMLSATDLCRLRDHAVSSEYSTILPQASFHLSLEDFIRLRDHGVAPAEVAAWKRAGFELDSVEVCRLRNHSVTADYGRSVKEAIGVITVDELIRLRGQGVPEAYLRQMLEIDPRLKVADLIQLRTHAVDSGYVRAWRDAGCDFKIQELVRLRDHGVPVTYARVVHSTKNQPISVSTLIELHNKGLSPAAVRQMRE